MVLALTSQVPSTSCTPLNSQSDIPAACTARNRSLSLLQRAHSEGSRASATTPTNSHRALLRRRHSSSLNCAALAPVAGSNQSCTADVLASRTTSGLLALRLLQQHNERWARERGTSNAHPVASCRVWMLGASCADWRASR